MKLLIAFTIYFWLWLTISEMREFLAAYVMSQNPDNDITVDTSGLFASLWALSLTIIISYFLFN